MIKTIIATLLISKISCVVSYANPQAIYDDSSSWPYRVKYTGRYYADGAVPFNAKLPGVLVRIEEADEKYHAVIDFGGGGIHHIPTEFTDLAARSAEISDGVKQKKWPNYVLLLANKIICQTDGQPKLLRAHDLAEYSGFAFLYLDKNNKESIRSVISMLPESLFDKHLVVVLPDYAYKESDLIEELSKDFKPFSFAVPKSYICPAIILSLHHGEEDKHPFIFTDLEGKVTYF